MEEEEVVVVVVVGSVWLTLAGPTFRFWTAEHAGLVQPLRAAVAEDVGVDVLASAVGAGAEVVISLPRGAQFQGGFQVDGDVLFTRLFDAALPLLDCFLGALGQWRAFARGWNGRGGGVGAGDGLHRWRSLQCRWRSVVVITGRGVDIGHFHILDLFVLLFLFFLLLFVVFFNCIFVVVDDLRSPTGGPLKSHVPLKQTLRDVVGRELPARLALRRQRRRSLPWRKKLASRLLGSSSFGWRAHWSSALCGKRVRERVLSDIVVNRNVAGGSGFCWSRLGRGRFGSSRARRPSAVDLVVALLSSLAAPGLAADATLVAVLGVGVGEGVVGAEHADDVVPFVAKDTDHAHLVGARAAGFVVTVAGDKLICDVAGTAFDCKPTFLGGAGGRRLAGSAGWGGGVGHGDGVVRA